MISSTSTDLLPSFPYFKLAGRHLRNRELSRDHIVPVMREELLILANDREHPFIFKLLIFFGNHKPLIIVCYDLRT